METTILALFILFIWFWFSYYNINDGDAIFDEDLKNELLSLARFVGLKQLQILVIRFMIVGFIIYILFSIFAFYIATTMIHTFAYPMVISLFGFAIVLKLLDVIKTVQLLLRSYKKYNDDNFFFYVNLYDKKLTEHYFPRIASNIFLFVISGTAFMSLIILQILG